MTRFDMLIYMEDACFVGPVPFIYDSRWVPMSTAWGPNSDETTCYNGTFIFSSRPVKR